MDGDSPRWTRQSDRGDPGFRVSALLQNDADVRTARRVHVPTPSTQPSEMLEAAWEALPLPVCVLDVRGALVSRNTAYKVTIGSTAIEIPRGRAAGTPIEIRHTTDEGECLDLVVHAAPMLWDGLPATLCTVHNSTEAREVARATVRAERIDAMRHATQRVAQDVRQSAADLQRLSRSLESTALPAAPEPPLLAELQRRTRRLVTYARQLELIGVTPSLGQGRTDLDQVLRDWERGARPMLEQRLEVTVQTGTVWPWVCAELQHVEYVVRALVENAVEAMPEGGVLRITTREVVRRKGEVVPEGRYTVLAVSDTGIGMGPDITARLFEPFFTTKGARPGRGLSLATVCSLAQGWGGYVVVRSELGMGSVFEVYMPVAEGETPRMHHMQEGGPLRGRRVLLAEDEGPIRTLLEEVLMGCGASVISVADTDSGKEAVRASVEPIDLVITDVRMPGVPVTEFLREVRAEHPDVGVLLISGYTRSSIELRDVLDFPRTAFLQKPFLPPVLLERLTDLLPRDAT